MNIASVAEEFDKFLKIAWSNNDNVILYHKIVAAKW